MRTDHCNITAQYDSSSNQIKISATSKEEIDNLNLALCLYSWDVKAHIDVSLCRTANIGTWILYLTDGYKNQEAINKIRRELMRLINSNDHKRYKPVHWIGWWD